MLFVGKSLLGVALTVLVSSNSISLAAVRSEQAGSHGSEIPSAASLIGSNDIDAADEDGSKSLRKKASANADGATTAAESPKKVLHPPTTAARSAPVLTWLPEGKPKLAMLCIHGFSLHKGCYTDFGKEMAKEGIATYAMDLRGFGEIKDTREHTELDFDGCLVDIKAMLERIHKQQPGVPVIILGESMGGAIALRITALYPDLVSGLISSVPARDRFGLSETEAKVGLKAGFRTIFGGFSKPMDNAALAAVQKISAKEDLRKQWMGDDPLMRTNFSAKEFIQFDEFMADNLNAAAMVKDTPVLFIQGTNDKLIRPAGTWKLFERLETPNRQMVLSKNSEHLIFEEKQFKPEDVRFVTTWIDRNVAHLDPSVVSSVDKLPVVASAAEYAGGASGNNASTTAAISTGNAPSMSAGTATGSPSGSSIVASTSPETPAKSTMTADGNVSASELVSQLSRPAGATPTTSISASEQLASASEQFKHRLSSSSPQINFWIELNRDNKTFRCNNKMQFKTGDRIRFHLIPGTDGFASLVMKAGTTGKSDVLFPNPKYGTENYLNHGKDYPIPAVGWMQFDQHPGTEQLGLVFANVKVDVTPETLKNKTMTAFVSHDQSGSKDLCPTRMKLSWDDPMPVVIPDDFSAISQVQNASDSSLVRLGAANGGMVSASISLLHDNSQ